MIDYGLLTRKILDATVIKIPKTFQLSFQSVSATYYFNTLYYSGEMHQN